MTALTYKAAGVDIALKERMVPLIRKLAAPTAGASVMAGVGGFGALVALDRKSARQPVLVAGTDGVGTKLKVAQAMRRHDTVGIDCVAMCVNDIICANARPLFFLDYIGIGKLDRKLVLEIISGVAEGCRQAGASLVGGETAQLPGVYRTGEYDLVGFAVGLAEARSVPQTARLRAGDVLVGLAASGLHSNGYSLARKILLERAGLKLGKRLAELGCTLGEELLRPTRIYAGPVEELFAKYKMKALANITGGGIPENLPRVIPAGLRATIRRGSWQIPPIFELIRRLGKVAQREMDRTFNNGIGMIGVFAPADGARAVAALKKMGVPAYLIGELSRGPRAVGFV